jgi:hypothetical protein
MLSLVKLKLGSRLCLLMDIRVLVVLTERVQRTARLTLNVNPESEVDNDWQPEDSD